VKKKFKHLIVIGHPNEKSFCYNGILKPLKENYKSMMKIIKSLICIEIIFIHQLERN